MTRAVRAPCGVTLIGKWRRVFSTVCAAGPRRYADVGTHDIAPWCARCRSRSAEGSPASRGPMLESPATAAGLGVRRARGIARVRALIINDVTETPIEARLAEYAALRAETLNRCDAQRLLINLNLTATAALTAVAVARPGNAGLMIVLAYVSPTLGLLFARNVRSLARIGRYVRAELWIGWQPSWEDWLLEQHRAHPWHPLDLPIPGVLVFVGPALAGLIVSVRYQSDIGGAVVWWIGLAIAAWFVLGAAMDGIGRRLKRFRELRRTADPQP